MEIALYAVLEKMGIVDDQAFRWALGLALFLIVVGVFSVLNGIRKANKDFDKRKKDY